MRSTTLSKLDLSYSQHVPRAFLVAFLITLDDRLAERLSLRAFRRSMGGMQDLRGADLLEARVLRSVVSGAQRARLLRRQRSDDALGAAWLRLPVIGRAALVLSLVDGLSPRRIADVLECSDAAVASLTTKGITRLGEHLGRTDHHDRLAALLKKQAGLAPPAPLESDRLRRSVGARRALTVATTSLAAMLLVAAAVAGAGSAVRRASSAPEPPELGEDIEGGSGGHVLRSIVDELRQGCPNRTWMLPLPKEAGRGAAQVAELFNKAVVRDQKTIVEALSDPTARPTGGEWAHTMTDKGLTVTSSKRVSKSDLFTIACGRATTRRSMRVVMHDRTGVTSEGLAFFYLGYTPQGWLVWGADEPGA